jgi:tetratricopeptide (TPR) repeat protein
MLTNILDRISFWSFFVVVALLPIFVIPFVNIPIETSKTVLLVLGTAISFIAWAAARFSDGRVVLPKSKLILVFFAISIFTLISSLFSGSIKMSLFGVMFDIGSFYFSLFLAIFLLNTALVVNNENKAKLILKGIILSSFVLFVFQIARFFIPNTLSLGILDDKTNNLLGSWNAFGIFAGALAIISMFSLEFLSPTKKKKILLTAILIISLFLIASVNFPLIWRLLGIVSLVIFVYKISLFSFKKDENQTNKKFPTTSFSVIIVALLFFISGQFIGSYLPNVLGLLNIEVNPSYSTTWQVTKSVFKENPLLGIGPNKFADAWSLYKPSLINGSQFWNTPFSNAFGLIPTLMINGGILVGLLWLVFLVLTIFSGLKKLLNLIKEKYDHTLVLYFLLAIYMLLVSILYPAGLVLFVMSFVFLGIFIGLYANRVNNYVNINFLDDPRKSFVSILTLVLVIIATSGITFKFMEKFVSVYYYGKVVNATEVESAEKYIRKALLLNQNDLYLRTYSQVYLSKLNSLISKGDSLTDSEKVLLQTSIDEAVNGAVLATKYNKENYLNFEILGFVYKNAASLGIKDASTKAVESYTEASRLNPLNPLMKLEIARTYFIDKNIKSAREFALASIAIKPNFGEGLIFLAELEKGEGNINSAISYAEEALKYFPNDTNLVDYVKTLKGNKNTETKVEIEKDN